MDELKNMLKDVDKKTLEKGMAQATAFAKTAEGKAMIDKLKNNMPADRNALMKMLSENPDIIKTMESFFKN
ncbi:MAG: hypothetical protein IJN25_04065 [Clostridia bacterium]|nr:hypothetical protein [Oscillospiraceae bacterium]MBQ7032818.1 hypothetical protein [Clostridia bacterium]